MQRLSDALGIDQAKVEQAFQTVSQGAQGQRMSRSDFVNQVAQSLGVTADAMQAALEKARGGHHHHRGGAAGACAGRTDFNAALQNLAQALGVQPDQVKQAFEDAARDRSGTDGSKTDFLADVAQKLGVNPDALVSALENVFVGGSALSVHA
jgi:protein-disulfide isomerase-like protein with CxxC motif